jgi:DNA repair exonuclease SbcCD ATPase subunit
MDNKALNQSLIELEENLKSLQSARTQVNSLSDKSEKLLRIFSSSITQLNKIQNDFLTEKGVFLSRVGTNVKDLNETISNNKQQLIDSFEKLKNELTETVESTKEELLSFKENLIETEQALKNFDFEKSNNQIIANIQTTQKKIDLAIKTIQDNHQVIISRENSANEKIKKDFAATKEQLDKLQEQNKTLQKSFDSVEKSLNGFIKENKESLSAINNRLDAINDIMQSFEEINSKLELIKTENKKYFIIQTVIIVFGILVFLVLLYN